MYISKNDSKCTVYTDSSCTYICTLPSSSSYSLSLQPDADDAREKLISEFKLSEIQAKAIVEMRLRQLTGLEQDKLRNEYEEINPKAGQLLFLDGHTKHGVPMHISNVSDRMIIAGLFTYIPKNLKK